MKNNSGLYRVSQSEYTYKTSKGVKKKIRWKYQVNNELLKISLTSKSLLKLKMKVLEAHLDWGIIDLEQAKKSAELEKCSIKDLQGKYGIQV